VSGTAAGGTAPGVAAVLGDMSWRRMIVFLHLASEGSMKTMGAIVVLLRTVSIVLMGHRFVISALGGIIYPVWSHVPCALQTVRAAYRKVTVLFVGRVSLW
jgi:hypothetical protein